MANGDSMIVQYSTVTGILILVSFLVSIASIVVAFMALGKGKADEKSGPLNCDNVTGAVVEFNVYGYMQGFQVEKAAPATQCPGSKPGLNNPNMIVNQCDTVKITYITCDTLLHDFYLSDTTTVGSDLGFKAQKQEPTAACDMRNWKNQACTKASTNAITTPAKLEFIPTKDGDFVYFCSTSGHFATMNGNFLVLPADTTMADSFANKDHEHHSALYFTNPVDTASLPPAKTAGVGKTVRRIATEIDKAHNVRYTPKLDSNNNNKPFYYTLKTGTWDETSDDQHTDLKKDKLDNLVPVPKCKNDFKNSWDMKGQSFAFPDECFYPLPDTLNEQAIVDLPRRLKPMTHMIVLHTVEVVAEVEPGVTFEWYTYNGTVPGPPIRVRAGDWVDTSLINPSNSTMQHSIDFHAFTGPGGGAATLRSNPGETSRSIWQAINPGMYIYHCASHPIAEHISRGMYGAIIIEPVLGFPYSDFDMFLAQGELYLKYPLRNTVINVATDSMNTGDGILTYHNLFDVTKEYYEFMDATFFNGSPFGMVYNPVTAEVGDVIRIFMVTGGPNVHAAFHIIGEIFDRVWPDADFITKPQQNVQTTLVLPGSCVAVDFMIDVPGTYILVDHALTRTFVKGNLGFIRACAPNDSGCSGKTGSSKGDYSCGMENGGAKGPHFAGMHQWENPDRPMKGYCISCGWDRTATLDAAGRTAQDQAIKTFMDTCTITAAPGPTKCDPSGACEGGYSDPPWFYKP